MKFIIGVLLGILFGLIIMLLINQQPSSELTPQDITLTPTATLLSAETVVTQITSVEKLVTAEAVIETVVELENNDQYFEWRSGNPLVDIVITSFDKVLGKRYIKMQGKGIVKAGVDLSKLDTNRDVVINTNDNSITIELPPSELLGKAEIDPEYTYPLTLEQGILISKNDYTITKQGYDEVFNQLNTRVCNSQVLQLAADNAEQSVERLVRAFNPTITTITVNSRSGDCGN
jgi:CDP-glycerol glycerophosphotransferase (TagB/SpsB family)